MTSTPVGESAVRVEVEVRRDGVWSRGILTIGVEGERTVRNAEALSCEEVLAALAAMAVVALDARSETSAPRTPGRGEPPRPPAQPPPPASAAPSLPPVGPRRRLAFGGGVTFDVLGHAPLVVSRGLFVEARLASVPRMRDDGAIARLEPSLRLGLSRTSHAEIGTARGPASLVWTVADVRACVDVLRLAGVHVAPCASGAFGELDAAAFAPAIPTVRSRPWATVGALARVRWSPLPLLSVEWDVGVSRPLVRDAMYFEPATLIYRAPVLVPTAGLSIMAELP